MFDPISQGFCSQCGEHDVLDVSRICKECNIPNKYKVEVTFHQGSPREFTWEGTYKTLEDALNTLDNWCSGNSLARAWVNNKEVERITDATITVPSIGQQLFEAFRPPSPELRAMLYGKPGRVAFSSGAGACQVRED